jgi:hypothetical protein
VAVTYNNTIKDARMNAVLSSIDGQTAHATLEICTAAYATVLSTITLGKPSFSEASQALTLLGVPLQDSSAANNGTAAIARIKDGAGTVQISGLTVGVGSGDIQLGSTAISSGEVVQITSGTINHSV